MLNGEHRQEDKMKKTWIIASLAAVVLGTSTAFATEPYMPRQERAFTRLDANSDGKLSKDELKTVVIKRFARLDSNSDQSVSADEIEKTMQLALTKRRDRIMKFMDRDANGTITQTELDNVLEAMFNSADADDDGGVTLTEAQGFKRAEWRRGMLEKGAN
jgi:Ca2+-binding EF-hand superfamily protein